MRHYFIILYLTTFIGIQTSYSQDKTKVSFSYQSKNLSYNAAEHLKQKLESDPYALTFSNSSILDMEASLVKSSSKTIEGMETKKLSKATFKFIIKNTITQEDTILTKSFQTSVNSDQDVDRGLINDLDKDKDFLLSISKIINEYHQKAINDCSSYIAYLKEIKEKESISQTMIQLIKLEQSLINCDLKDYKQSLQAEYDVYICEKILFEAEVLISSGVEFQINKAVNLLLQIPPTAQCRDKTKGIIVKLYEKSNLSQVNKERISLYNIYVNNNDVARWLDLQK